MGVLDKFLDMVKLSDDDYDDDDFFEDDEFDDEFEEEKPKSAVRSESAETAAAFSLQKLAVTA